MTSPALRVEHLNRFFGDFQAVRDVSFQVRKGEFFGYLGANGAGKSTTIKMLCGLLEPSSGSAEVAGINVAKSPNEVKKRIGYMSQKFSLYPDLAVEENLRFFAGAYGLSGKALRYSLDAVLEEVKLTAFRKELTGELAGGWQQRVALGNALLHNPEILFLDEPTAGVDPTARREFIAIVRRRVERGVTAFLTTHYLDEAEFCERVGLMVSGRLATLGTPSELKELHVPGDWWALQSLKHKTLASELAKHPSIISTQTWGKGLRIRTTKNAFSFETFANTIHQLDQDAKVALDRATLDDVFFAVVAEDAP
jgi:ABC-2 type transport system ATP-binding protein